MKALSFTAKTPDKIGAYWWVNQIGDRPMLREIFNPVSEVLIERATDLQPQDLPGLWCGPLVPEN